MNKKQSAKRYMKRHSKDFKKALNEKSNETSAQNPVTETSKPDVDPASIIPETGPKGKKKRNILIHPDHIEDLDETNKKLEENGIEVKDTGYASHLKLINRPSKWNGIRRAVSTLLEKFGFPEDYVHPLFRRRILLHGSFVRSKMKTRTAFIFTSRHKDDMLVQDVYLQGCPVHYMQRTSVFHIKRKPLSWLRWWGYYADLDMTPEPQSILLATNRSPTIESYTYKIVEQTGRDQHLKDVFNYRFIS